VIIEPALCPLHPVDNAFSPTLRSPTPPHRYARILRPAAQRFRNFLP
jgi:hypothetical protein